MEASILSEMQWDDIRFFLALASAGTQKAAAVKLGVDQATVGRRIKELESSLGTKLFDKRSDGFLLTAAGTQLIANARDIERSIAEIERGAQALDARPRGTVRIAMPGALANHWLVPRLPSFFEEFPDIRLEFLTGPEVINLWKREADIAIRLVQPVQKELFHRKLGEMKLAVFGAKSLAARTRGIGKKGLERAPFVGLFESATSEAERRLLASLPPFQNVVCRSHAWSSVYYSVRAGLGIGILPSFFNHDSELVELSWLPSFKTPLWFVTHPDVRKSGRVKAFADFLFEQGL